MASLLPLHQVPICKTHALPQFRRFWNLLQTELINKGLFSASIGSMRFRIQELQEINCKAQESRQKDSYQEINRVLHHQGLLFVSKAIRIKLISRNNEKPLASYFGIEKNRKLLVRKYYWRTLYHNVEAYVKSYDICLALRWSDTSPTVIFNLCRYSLINEKPLDGLYDWSTHFMHLEKRQLWLYSSHRRLANKDGPLQANKNDHQWPKSSGGHNSCGSLSPHLSRLNRHW